MEFRTLNWHPSGYRPVGYDWPNYTVGLSSFLLSHDLYHHQLGESGKRQEEVRALGGQLRFEHEGTWEGRMHDFFRQMNGAFFRMDAKPPEICPNPLPLIEYFFHYECGFLYEQARYWINVVMEGYNNALKFDDHLPKLFEENRFDLCWDRGSDVIVDLMTGQIVDEPLSEVAVEHSGWSGLPTQF